MFVLCEKLCSLSFVVGRRARFATNGMNHATRATHTGTGHRTHREKTKERIKSICFEVGSDF